MNSHEVLDDLLCGIATRLGLVYENKRNVVDNPLCDCGTIKSKSGEVIMKVSLSDLRYDHTIKDVVTQIMTAAKAKNEQPIPSIPLVPSC